MMEVHYYDPYNFTLNEESNISQWGSIATDPELTETWANESYVNYQFGRMKTHFVDQGIGVILGEYGVISRVNVADHETYRRYWNEYITASALEHGSVPVYWDNGWAGNFGFALFDRHNGAHIEPEWIQAILGTADGPAHYNRRSRPGIACMPGFYATAATHAPSRLLKNVFEAGYARQKWPKKRSLLE